MDEISLHILDIIENSINAGASRILLKIIKDSPNDLLKVIIKDNGRGMTPEQVAKSTDPFYSTKTRGKGGLGLALVKQTCEQTQCSFFIDSVPGAGTMVEALMKLSHPDRPVMGNLAGSLTAIIAGLGDPIDLLFEVDADGFSYILDTVEIKKELDGMPVSHPSVLKFIRDDIADNIKNLFD